MVTIFFSQNYKIFLKTVSNFAKFRNQEIEDEKIIFFGVKNISNVQKLHLFEMSRN